MHTDNLSSLDLHAEESAEDYFVANGGKPVRGTFQEVGSTKWDQDEADWSVGDLGFELCAQSKPTYSVPRAAISAQAEVECQKTVGRNDAHQISSFAQNELRFAVLRIRRAAAERNWLSPKSILALAAIADAIIILARPKLNALNHLLGRCENTPALRADVEIVRKVARNQGE